MPEESFDLDSLLRFSPPRYLCAKCCAILFSDGPNLPRMIYKSNDECRCPICGVQYKWDGSQPHDAGYGDFVRAAWSGKFTMKFEGLIEHGQKLARIGGTCRDSLGSSSVFYPPMRAVLNAMLAAQNFVHFTTYGMSQMFFGSMKVISEKVAVRGVVSNAESWMRDELQECELEAPELEIKLFDRTEKPEAWNTTPHQKLIIVDGLLAFTGSANLTNSGLRKAAKGLDTFQVLTDVGKVAELHNRYFSPVWATFDDQHTIEMSLPDDY